MLSDGAEGEAGAKPVGEGGVVGAPDPAQQALPGAAVVGQQPGAPDIPKQPGGGGDSAAAAAAAGGDSVAKDTGVQAPLDGAVPVVKQEVPVAREPEAAPVAGAAGAAVPAPEVAKKELGARGVPLGQRIPDQPRAQPDQKPQQVQPQQQQQQQQQQQNAADQGDASLKQKLSELSEQKQREEEEKKEAEEHQQQLEKELVAQREETERLERERERQRLEEERARLELEKEKAQLELEAERARLEAEKLRVQLEKEKTEREASELAEAERRLREQKQLLSHELLGQDGGAGGLDAKNARKRINQDAENLGPAGVGAGAAGVLVGGGGPGPGPGPGPAGGVLEPQPVKNGGRDLKVNVDDDNNGLIQSEEEGEEKRKQLAGGNGSPGEDNVPGPAQDGGNSNGNSNKSRKHAAAAGGTDLKRRRKRHVRSWRGETGGGAGGVPKLESLLEMGPQDLHAALESQLLGETLVHTRQIKVNQGKEE